MNKVRQLNLETKKSFSEEKYFPGTEGNPFDSILRWFNNINLVSPLLFFLGVAIFIFLCTFLSRPNWLMLLVFFLLDWLIIAILPKVRITFGPPQSQVFLLLVMRLPFIWLPFPFNLVFQVVGTLLVLVGFVYEPSQLVVAQQVLIIPSEKTRNDITFVQMGDLHLERKGVRENKLLQLLEKLHPEFVLFTGDFLNLSNNADPLAIATVSSYFSEINQISPTFFVSGSPAVDLDETFTQIVAGTKATPLVNSSHQIEHEDGVIQLIGLSCSHKPAEDIQQLAPIQLCEKSIKILMYHSPDLIYELTPEDGIDLMLSGHTHGGQVRLPLFGAIFTASLYGRKLQAGLYRLGGTLLSISRGIGFEGMGAPRVRFFCKPEIIHWTIKASKSD